MRAMAVGASHSILIHSEGDRHPGINTAFLRQPNIRMVTCNGEVNLLDAVRRAGPDLVIEVLDPDGGDVDPLCSSLKADALTRTIPVILVAPIERRSQAGLARPDELLVKPLVPRELFEAVNRFVPLPMRRGLRYDVNLRFGIEYDGRSMQVFTRNVSLNGAFIKTDREIPVGTHLRLRFSLPGQMKEIRCGAIARQSVGDNPAPRHTRGVGVEFEGISDDDLERLETYINSHARRSRFL